RVDRAVAERSAVDATDRSELLAAVRRPAHDADQREVRQHEPRRDVERGRGALAPRAYLLRDAARPPAQLAGALHAPPCDFRFGTSADSEAAFLAFVERPGEPTHRFEAPDEHVVQRDEVLDVGRRVRALLAADRASRPVGEAIALGEPDVEESLDERR